MRVISVDPNDTVPDITESDINHKAILMYLIGNSDRKFVGMAVGMVTTAEFVFRGGNISDSSLCTWSPCGNSLISLLCKGWTCMKSSDYDISIYVIESLTELNDFVLRFNIENNDVIALARRTIGDTV